MVSVIVPVYNVENYIDKCLRSIVNQTFKDIEIILIDDGSTDRSGEICLKWQEADDRIIYIRKKNEGQGPARNLGVKIAKGDYITFVDSDDWIEENAIECLYEGEKKSNADIVFTDVNFIIKDSNGNLQPKSIDLPIESEVLLYPKEDTTLISKIITSLCGKLYKRDFYINSKVMQPNHVFEDTVAVPLLMVKADTMYYMPKSLYNYDISRQDSTIHNVDSFKYMVKSLETIRDEFKKEGLFKKYYDSLKKMSDFQIKYVSWNLSLMNEDTYEQGKDILDELNNFMDYTYPD